VLASCLRLTKALLTAVTAHINATGGLDGSSSSGATVTRSVWEQNMLARYPRLAAGDRLSLMLTDRDFDGNDYAALLELDADNVAPAAVGATEAEIRRNPVFIVK
jgi:hypothetical protein